MEPASSVPRAGGAPLVGLTGLCCAGKNHAARIFEAYGVPVLDVDRVGHKAVAMQRDAIAARFGEDMLDGGGVDRKKLGAKVFGKPEALRALEEIVHPVVDVLIEDWIASHAGRAVVINAALLHKCACFDRLRAVIVIRAPFLVRLYRAKKRDGAPLARLLQRFASQKAFPAQYLPKNADTKIIQVTNVGPGLEKKLQNLAIRDLFDT
jgi:dephospho-CoA kinase